MPDTKRSCTVLFFTHHLNAGGAEKTVRSISAWIKEHPMRGDLEVQPHIAVVYDDQADHTGLAPVHVLPTASRPEDNKIHKFFNVLRQRRELRDLKRELGVDVCVSFLPGADILNVFSGAGERRIVSVRAIESRWVWSVLKKWYVQAAYRRCDRIIAVSEVVRQDCIDYFKVPEDKIVTIRNSYTYKESESKMTANTKEFIDNVRSNKDNYLMVAAGRFVKAKGFDILMEAMAEMPENTYLLLIGDGEEREALEAQVERLGLTKRVFMPGWEEEITPYLEAGDVFVLSSRVEGLPNVVLEAVGAGLPVIATDCGAAEILDPGYKSGATYPTSEEGITALPGGLLVPTEDKNALAAAVKAAMKSERWAEDCKACREDILAQFDAVRIGELWKEEVTRWMK